MRRLCALAALAALAALVALPLSPRTAAAEVPVIRTVHFLPSSNGRGAVMLDLDTAKIAHFRERLPATEEPVLDTAGKEIWTGNEFDVVRTRDLLFDAYFGVRRGGTQRWLPGLPVDRDASGYAPWTAGKVGGTGIALLVQRDGDLEATTYAFAPRALRASGFVMALRLRNTGSTKITGVGSFSLHNFHLGFGRPGVRSKTGENGETAVFHPGTSDLEERGFAGVIAARPLGAEIHHAAFSSATTGAGNAYEVVNAGGAGDLTDLAGTAPTADGTVTAFQFDTRDLGAGEELWSGVAFAHHGDPLAVKTTQDALSAYVGGRDAKAVVTAELAAWKTYQEARQVPTGLSVDEEALYRQSVAMLSMAQVTENEAFLREVLSKDGEPRRTRFGTVAGGPAATLPAIVKHRGEGAVIASLPPGEWTISWIRDASYAIAAMSAAGMTTEAKAALGFYLNAEAGRFQKWDELSLYSMPPYQMSLVRYQGFGVEETDFNENGPNLEFDGFGLFLWALRRYEIASGDDTFTKANWPTVSTKVADVIIALVNPASGLLQKDSSIWETHWKGRERAWTYTNLTAAKGLCDAAEMAAHVGDEARAKSYRERGIALRAAIANKLLTSKRALASNREELEQGEEGCYDAAVIDAISMGLFDPKGTIAKATLEALDIALLAPAGAGWSRNDDNKDHASKNDLSPWGGQYDSAEWVVTDLRGAMATRLVGDTVRADRLLSWVLAQSKQNYLEVAETYDETTGQYKFNSPMVGFGAGAYILALAQRGGLDEEPACGAYFDESTLPPLGAGGAGAGGSGASGAAGKSAGGAGGTAAGGKGGSTLGGGKAGASSGAGGIANGGAGGVEKGGAGAGAASGGGQAGAVSTGGGGQGPGGKQPRAGSGGGSGAGGVAAPAASASDDGCGCRVAGEPSSPGLLTAAATLALALGLRRKRRVGRGLGPAPHHSFFWTTGSCNARSRSRSRLPTCSESGDCTHL